MVSELATHCPQRCQAWPLSSQSRDFTGLKVLILFDDSFILALTLLHHQGLSYEYPWSYCLLHT